MNEPLRRALLRARLREDDVAARLGVDPKTVRRWLNGRIPYANNRAALADLVGADEADLWPEAAGPLAARFDPKSWEQSTRTAGLFPAMSGHASSNQPSMRSASWPTAPCSSPKMRAFGVSSPIKAVQASRSGLPSATPTAHRWLLVARRKASAMPCPPRSVMRVTLYSSLRDIPNIEIRLHRTVLYNSIYRADDQLLVNQHAYGIHSAHAPVFCLQESERGDMTDMYIASFERVWSAATSI